MSAKRPQKFSSMRQLAGMERADGTALRDTEGCKVAGCERPYLSRGWCKFHYQRSYLGVPFDAPVRGRKGEKPCSHPGCTKPMSAKGFCDLHSAHAGFGGAAGGYSRSAYTAAALGGVGKTLTYTVGAGGAASANPGGASSIVAGTVTGFTSMNCNGGGAGVSTGAAGGTASGGTAANTTGASVASGAKPGATGTTGTVGGDGSPYGGGGAGGTVGTGHPGAAGLSGAAVFAYT